MYVNLFDASDSHYQLSIILSVNSPSIPQAHLKFC